jgi:hypothetical protein
MTAAQPSYPLMDIYSHAHAAFVQVAPSILSCVSCLSGQIYLQVLSSRIPEVLLISQYRSLDA